MTTRQRLDLLARAHPRLFPRAELLRLLREQLGAVDAIETGRIRPPRLIVHICAGNLAISAFTSLAHGLLLGARNIVKLPGDRDDSTTRGEITAFIARLPTPLRRLIHAQRELNDTTLREADAVIAFGSDATMDSLRARLRWDQKFSPHGHAVSLLWLPQADALTARQARACAIDVLTYDQLGCLSPQAIYVPPRTDIGKLGEKLAKALEHEMRAAARGSRRRPSGGLVDFRVPVVGTRSHARPPLGQRRLPEIPPRPLPTAARIAEARDLAHALGHRIWLPPARHLGWTLIHDPDPTFAPSPLHGVIYLRTASESQLPRALAPVKGRISTVGLIGKISPRAKEAFLKLGVTRFCPAGRMQFPPLTWHHDGRAPLAELVTWIDDET